MVYSNVMIRFGLLLLSLAILHLDTGAAFRTPNGSYISNAGRLYDYLMKDYKKSVRPICNSMDSIKVDLRLEEFTVEDLDEMNQVFKMYGYLIKTWKDCELVWNPADFGGINHTTLAVGDIWIPDVTISNSRDAYFQLPTHYLAFVNNNGGVFWDPQVNIETYCQIDLSEFPFDEHVCQIVFGSWAHTDLAINLTSKDLYKDTESLLNRALRENPEWKVTKITVERHEVRYPCCESNFYPDITFNFTLKRRSSFTTHMFIGPSVMLCIVTPVVFLLPPGSGDKMMFGIGVLIADTLLLGQLINYIPAVHPNLPLIAKYFLANIVMASLSLAISAIIIGFWDKGSSRLSGPPAFLGMIFLGPLATVLCIKKEDLFAIEEVSSGVREINPEGEEGTESTSGVDPGTDRKQRFMTNYLRNAARSEWRQLAVVFDRLLFVIYCVILAILTLSFARYI